MSDDLVAFLRARLDEEQRIARGASDGPWKPGVRSGLDAVEGDGWTVCNASDADVAHIAAHDPVRVLAEVAAKRSIVDYNAHAAKYHEPSGAALAMLTLRALAVPYRSHPDYQPKWAPVA